MVAVEEVDTAEMREIQAETGGLTVIIVRDTATRRRRIKLRDSWSRELLPG